MKNKREEPTNELLSEWGLKNGHHIAVAKLRERFTEHFARLFELPLTQFRERAIKKYINERGLSEKEADEIVSRTCDSVTAYYANQAGQFYEQQIDWVLRRTSLAVIEQASTFARAVLDGFDFAEESEFTSLSIFGPEKDKLMNATLGPYFADIRSNLNNAIKEERRRQESLIAEKNLQQMIVLCREISEYHDNAKQEFKSQFKFRYSPPSHDQWMSEWLDRAKAQFGHIRFSGINDPAGLRPFPADFFRRFASLDREESTPEKIAQFFVSRMLFNVSPSHLAKRVLHKGTKKLKKNVRQNDHSVRTKKAVKKSSGI
jgi:hypothetical protein